MLTRPLELSSRLRQAPRNFDHVFLINLGLIALFFRVFDLPYLMAPVLELPVSARAGVGAPSPTMTITVKAGKDGPAIYVVGGVHNLAQFKVRLKEHARSVKAPVLLMLVDRRVEFGDWSAIKTAAEEAGFLVTTAAQSGPREGATTN